MAKNGKDSGANLGFEDKLWATADKLRGNLDSANYKHVVLGLVFLKYISDAFQAKYDELQSQKHANPEDRDEYLASGRFWVPVQARWQNIQNNAKQATIGQIIDEAMVAIERENPESKLKGVLPKTFGSPDLDKRRLGEVVDLIGQIDLVAKDEHQSSKDILGRVYEYFLGKFAAAEGKSGGEFYTPQCIVQLLVAMLEPYTGRVFDPCCGSGGMFVQSEKFVEEHGGRIGDISVYGQESNPTTWKLARMNLAIRGIDADLGRQHDDSFHNDLHKDVKADFIIANPPFNLSDWGGNLLESDVRWEYGQPPVNNANYAWIQHFLYHLAPHGTAGFVLANGSMSTSTTAEFAIRKAIIEADLVDCMVALPGQLFYTTQIPVCLWFLARNKTADKKRGYRNRQGRTLFIDARKMGTLIDRVHRELSTEEIAEIAGVYHSWRSEGGKFKAKPGWWKSATLEEIQSHDYVLTPGRYVGAEDIEDDGISFEEKMTELSAKLYEQMAESSRLDKIIKQNLTSLGYPPEAAKR